MNSDSFHRSGISILLLALSMVFTACSNFNEQNGQNDITDQISYFNTKALIEAEDLHHLLSKNQIQLIDFRDHQDYLLGHIPGAVNIEKRELIDTSSAIAGLKADIRTIESVLQQQGITSDKTIVIYDNKAACDAARLWWILDIHGHKEIALLNGGIKSWIDLGFDLSTEPTIKTNSEFNFDDLNNSLNVDADFVRERINDREWKIVDARSIEEYSGLKKSRDCLSFGRIPNSEFIDWSFSVNYHGNKKFKSAAELKTIFEEKGISSDKHIINYCRSGVRSAHTTFVLKELLGYKNVYNYDGSWLEWSHLEGYPVQVDSMNGN